MKHHLGNLLTRCFITILGLLLAVNLQAKPQKVPYEPPAFQRTAYLVKAAAESGSNLSQLRAELASTEARILLTFGDQVFVISHLEDLEKRTKALSHVVPLAGITAKEADMLCKGLEEEACTGLGYWAIHEAEEVADIEGITGSVAELYEALVEQEPIADDHYEDPGHVKEGELPSELSSFPAALPSADPEDVSFEPLFAGGGIDLDLLTSLLGRDWAEKFFETDKLPEPGAALAKAVGYTLSPEFYGEHKELEAVLRNPGECGPPEPLLFSELNDITYADVSYLDRYFNYSPLSPRHASLQSWDFMGGDVLALVVVVEGDGDWNSIAVAQRSYPAVRAWEEWADWNNRVARKEMTVHPVVRRHGMSDLYRPARRLDHSGGCAEWIDLDYNARLLRRLRDAVGANCGNMDEYRDVSCMLDAWRRTRPAGEADWAHLHVILDGRGNNGFEDSDYYGLSCTPMAWSLYTNVIIARYNVKLAFHEIGHAASASFATGALDEYGSHKCDEEGGYYKTLNLNANRANGGGCPSTSRRSCIYRKDPSWLADVNNIPVCDWTKRMVGLWDSDNDCVLDQNDTHPFVMVEKRPDLFYLYDQSGSQTRQIFRGIAWDCGTQSVAVSNIRTTTNEIIRLRYHIKANAVGLRNGTPLGDVDGHIVGEDRVVTLSNPGASYAPFTLQFDFANGATVPTLSSDALEIVAINDVENGSDLSAVACGQTSSSSNASTAGDGPVYVDFSMATPILFPAGMVETLPFVVGYEPKDGQWLAVQDVETALDKLLSAMGHTDFGALLIQSPQDLEKLGFLAGQDFSMWQVVE